MNSAEFYLSAMDVIRWLFDPKEKPAIKYNEMILQNNKRILDISLKNPQQEDENYQESIIVRNNIRRGNSLLLFLSNSYKNFESYKPKKKKKETNPEESNLFVSNKLTIDVIEHADWIRRGLIKFFDLSMSQFNLTENIDIKGSFSEQNENFKEKIPKNKKSKTQENKNDSEIVRKILFFDIEKALLAGKSIFVYKTEKANGENVQIAYSSTLSKWVISSKNSCLLAENYEESCKYTENRFEYAKKIANTWFSLLRLCPNINSLKTELEGKTLVGEYIGNAECLHIVKYNHNTIKFYAIVDNNSCYTCLPPIAAFGFFRKYNLETVSILNLGSYNKISELYNSLKRVYKEISEQDLESGGEGSVLYFVENDFNGLEIQNFERDIFNKEENEFDFDLLNHISSLQKTLVLGKIKTLEYRIIRKIREKAKHISVNEENNIKVKNSFMDQFSDLTEGFVLPKPKDYYINFFYEIKNRVVDLIKSEKIGISRKKHAKIDFNKIIHNFNLDYIPDQKSKYNVPILIEIAYSIKLNFSDLAAGLNYQESNQNKIDSLKPNKLYHDFFTFDPSRFSQNKYLYGFVGFGEERLEEEMNLSEFYDSECLSRKFNISMKKQKAQLPQMVKKAFYEKRKLIQTIGSYPNAEVIEISPTAQENIIEILKNKITEIGEIEDFVEEVKKTHKKRVFLLLPLGIPGIGKTYLNQFFFNYIKKKDIGFKLIKSDEIRKKCMDACSKQNSSLTYSEVFKVSAEEANKNFKVDLLTKISNAKDCSIVYCDKNFPPRALESTLNTIKNEVDSSIEIISIGLFPESEDYILPNKKFEISYGLLLSSIVRVLKRKNHPTLNGTDSNKIGVVLSMFNAYKNFSVKNDHRLTKILKIKFSAEVEDLDEVWIKKRIDSLLIDLEDNYHYDNEDFSDIAAYARDLTITECDFTMELEEKLDKVTNEYK